jgi:endonuclease G
MRSSNSIAGVAVVFLFTVTTAMAGQTSCPDHFAGGQTPDFTNQKLSVKTQEVCYSGFALKHSGVTRTPLYSAEHLTRNRLMQAKGMKRKSKFFPDPNIPASERAELHHYQRTGFDRGHMAPSADMPDERSQQECFSLANIVPQNPDNNRRVWEGVESAVRKLTKERGELYVVTGPIFKGDNLQRIGGTVIVPTQLFKAIYDPQRHEAGAYLVDNSSGAQPQSISILELEKVASINIFPAVKEQTKARAMKLPEPKSYKDRKRKKGY